MSNPGAKPQPAGDALSEGGLRAPPEYDPLQKLCANPKETLARVEKLKRARPGKP